MSHLPTRPFADGNIWVLLLDLDERTPLDLLDFFLALVADPFFFPDTTEGVPSISMSSSSYTRTNKVLYHIMLLKFLVIIWLGVENLRIHRSKLNFLEKYPLAPRYCPNVGKPEAQKQSITLICLLAAHFILVLKFLH